MKSEKLSQIESILHEFGIDLWMIVEKESGITSDPATDFLIGQHATWLSFFIFTKTGGKYAIVGNLDEEKFTTCKLFDQVITYLDSPKKSLLELLNKIAMAAGKTVKLICSW